MQVMDGVMDVVLRQRLAREPHAVPAPVRSSTADRAAAFVRSMAVTSCASRPPSTVDVVPQSPSPFFSDDIVAAVLAHMNSDHNDDNLLIARAFGAQDATTAVMTTLDHTGGTWLYTADAEHSLTVSWSTEIAGRAEIRREIVRLYDLACEKLGVQPRPH